MSDIEFVDVNCTFGPRSKYVNTFPWCKEELLKNLKKFEIEKALVFHSYTKEYNPDFGNSTLLKEIEGDKRLVPCWGVLPHGELESNCEQMESTVFLSSMKSNDVRAVRVFPDESVHRFSLNEWIMGDFYREFEQHRLPLLVDYGPMYSQLPGSSRDEGTINWNEIYNLCQHHKNLPVILMHPGYRTLRNLLPLLKQCPNLKIDISRLMTHRGIEKICKEFGAERLIFGSGYPFQSPGVVMTMLLYAKISKEEKQLIASYNLENILESVRW